MPFHCNGGRVPLLWKHAIVKCHEKRLLVGFNVVRGREESVVGRLAPSEIDVSEKRDMKGREQDM